MQRPSAKDKKVGVHINATRKAVFTLVTLGRFMTSASKFYIEPCGGIFDVSPENDCASPNVKTPKTRPT